MRFFKPPDNIHIYININVSERNQVFKRDLLAIHTVELVRTAHFSWTTVMVDNRVFLLFN